MTFHTSHDYYRRRLRLVNVACYGLASNCLQMDERQNATTCLVFGSNQTSPGLVCILDNNFIISTHHRLVLDESFQNKRLDYTHTMTPVYLFVMVCRQDARQVSNTVGLCVQIHLSSSFFCLPTSLDGVNRQTGLDMTRFENILD